MSRDPGTPSDSAGELLTAYVDGVAELSPDDRRRIEARLASDPGARAEAAEVRTLVARLRALPAEAGEPDWAALERSIHAAVGPDVPRPWWRRWTWLVPASALAVAAAALLAIWPRISTVTAPGQPMADRGDPTQPADRRERADPPTGPPIGALWLDGAEFDVDLSASPAQLVGEVEPLDEPARGTDAESREVALLPPTNLGWLDELDSDALGRAERWLARKNG